MGVVMPMLDDYLKLAETAVNDLLVAFDVTTPPVPVEIMLQRPKAGMWKQINLSELSVAFINVKQVHSPRMSIARLLVRYICRSDWGDKHHIAPLITDDGMLKAFARSLLMPRSMLDGMLDSQRVPMTISARFEVPEEDARLRLIDLGYLPADPNPNP